MNITLVQPPALMAVDNYSTITQPPLGIAYLAAYARELGHRVTIVDAVEQAVTLIRPWPGRKRRLLQGLDFDEIIERIPSDTQVIGVSCMFTHAWPMVRELMHALKEVFPEAKLLAGGEHITAMSETVLRQTDVDFCVLGEGEMTLGDLLEAFAKDDDNYAAINGIAYLDRDSNEVVETGRRDRMRDPDVLPWPAWDLMDPMAYMANEVFMGPTLGRTMPMLATRGCPFACTFCSSPQMWTQLWRPRDPIKVADELEHYVNTYEADDFQFQDLTAIVRKDWIITFCKELIARDLNITWQLPVGTRSEAIDREVAEHLMASGCHHITYAPESGSERILKAIKKRVDLDALEVSAKGCLDAGMRVCLFNIIGFPQEEMSDIRKTWKMHRRMAKLGVHEITASTFVPLPGTELFHQTNEIEPLVIDDEYCHWMTASTSMWSVKSWNPIINARKLLALKFWTLVQFYGLSFCYHPSRLWRLVSNVLRNKQETKVDRVIREYIIKLRISITSVFRVSKARS
jgi:anaerobic magnesium-protoporphyrin IX monomethyl ester cyclase